MNRQLTDLTKVGSFQLPTLPGSSGEPWEGLGQLPARPGEFTFALLSDRTGGARQGVFERALEVVNLVRPDFAIQLGDTIEGADDPSKLSLQWVEFDALTARLQLPLLRVSGNHDVGTEVSRAEWQRRFGVLHYHFIYRDVLFIILDTQDPPQVLDDYLKPDLPPDVADATMATIRDLNPLFEIDRDAWGAKTGPLFESVIDFDGMQAHISDQQISWAEQVITEHAADVRWTVFCMHMPAWQAGGHPGFARLRHALGDRPYTMFSGHVHNYRREVIDSRDHIRLGKTGGSWVISGQPGNFDHITLVTMTPTGPMIANLLLDGVLDRSGKPPEPASRPGERR